MQKCLNTLYCSRTFLGLDYRDALLLTSTESDNFNIQKIVVKKVKNQHVVNELTEFLVKIIELLRILSST